MVHGGRIRPPAPPSRPPLPADPRRVSGRGFRPATHDPRPRRSGRTSPTAWRSGMPRTRAGGRPTDGSACARGRRPAPPGGSDGPRSPSGGPDGRPVRAGARAARVGIARGGSHRRPPPVAAAGSRRAVRAKPVRSDRARTRARPRTREAPRGSDGPSSRARPCTGDGDLRSSTSSRRGRPARARARASGAFATSRKGPRPACAARSRRSGSGRSSGRSRRGVPTVPRGAWVRPVGPRLSVTDPSGCRPRAGKGRPAVSRRHPAAVPLPGGGGPPQATRRGATAGGGTGSTRCGRNNGPVAKSTG